MPALPTADPQHKLHKTAVDVWFAVQGMIRRKNEPGKGQTRRPPDDQGPDDDRLSPSGVPLHPTPSTDSAAAAVEPTRSGDISES